MNKTRQVSSAATGEGDGAVGRVSISRSPWPQGDAGQRTGTVCGRSLTKIAPQGGFPGDSAEKNPPTRQKMWVWSLGQEDPLKEDVATHSSILAWKTPWTEEPGGLQNRQRNKWKIITRLPQGQKDNRSSALDRNKTSSLRFIYHANVCPLSLVKPLEQIVLARSLAAWEGQARLRRWQRMWHECNVTASWTARRGPSQHGPPVREVTGHPRPLSLICKSEDIYIYIYIYKCISYTYSHLFFEQKRFSVLSLYVFSPVKWRYIFTYVSLALRAVYVCDSFACLSAASHDFHVALGGQGVSCVLGAHCAIRPGCHMQVFWGFFLVSCTASVRDLRSLTRDPTWAPLQWKRKVLTTELPRNSPERMF